MLRWFASRPVGSLGALTVFAGPFALMLGCAQPSEGPPSGRGPGDSPSARGAEQPPPPSDSALITTDRDSYRVLRAADAIELDIVATFANRTADTVYLHPCGRSQPSFFLEKWVDGDWRAVYSPPCPAILMLDPPPIAPGASRTDTARVRASTTANTVPRFETDSIAGTYRLVYAQAYGSWRANQGPGELLPLGRRVSGAFRVER
jgi:hypothetical protein